MGSGERWQTILGQTNELWHYRDTHMYDNQAGSAEVSRTSETMKLKVFALSFKTNY